MITRRRVGVVVALPADGRHMFDHYQEARRLAALLTEGGLEDRAAALIEVIEVAATGTEIFMGLRWNLERLLAEDRHLPFEIRKLARKLRDELDKGLA